MNRRILLVATAVVLALIGTIAVYTYGRSTDNTTVAGSQAATVVITQKDIPAGTSWAETVKGGYLKQESLPANSVPASAVTNIKQAAIGTDAVSQSDIAAGQVVLRQAFGAKQAKTGVLSIPKGDIAISVSLDPDADVANFVGPGSQVIIFETSQLDSKKLKAANGDQLTVNRTLVPRAGVLATSTSAPTAVSGNSDGTSQSGQTTLVTLALSQQDAQRVILGQNVGQLYLGLLSSSSKVSMDGGLVNAGKFDPVPVWVK